MKTTKKLSGMHRKDGDDMRVLLLIFSTLFLMGADGVDRPRVVSTSLCGDSYVLSMIPHEDIAALSWQSGDALSTTPKAMRGKPKAWDDAERLLSLKPSLVVFGAGEGGTAKPLLDKMSIAHMTLQWGEDFISIEDNERDLAASYHIDFTERKMTPHPAPASLSILYLSISGGTAGPNTFIDTAIQAAGGTNIISKSGWHTPDPETLAMLKPDLIITSFFDDSYASAHTAGRTNKLLKNMLEKTPHVNVPGKLWPCAGPGLYDAKALISLAIQEISN